MNQMPRWAIIASICLVLAILLLAGFLLALLLPAVGVGKPESPSQNSGGLLVLTTEPETQPWASQPQQTAPSTQPTESTEPQLETKPASTQPEETLPEETLAPAAPPAPTNPPPTEPEPTSPPAPKYLTLPYTIPGTKLVVTQYNAFTGVYLEDGSDRSVDSIAALVVDNRGMPAIEYAQIDLTMESGAVLKFEITALPGGASIVVQEIQGSSWQSGQIKSCTAHVAVLDALPLSQDQVQVTEEANGMLAVTNLTDRTIPAVRVFYKFYMDDVDGYVGGITYTCKITDLAPGATQNIAASHYIKGFSTVVMVRTYETAE